MLAIAAILTACFSACSNEEILDNTVQPTQPQKIHVTVGAGLGDAETRSKVDYDATAKTRTLKFTACDQLYIVGDIDATHRMGGYLTLTSGAGTTSATFSGDLTVWVKPGNFAYEEDNTYTLQNPNNPMLEYGTNEVKATLIHKDAIEGAISVNSTKLYSFNYEKCLVTGQSDNASELMKSGIYVHGTYNATTESFSLSCGDPIFNCNFTVDGLTSGTAYYVRLEKDNRKITYDQAVTADANGYVHFACTTDLSGSGNWTIKLCANNKFITIDFQIYERPIGDKEIRAKVYNVGKAPDPDPDPTPGPTPDPTLDPTKDVISLSQVTSAFIGNVVGSDGLVYPPNATMPEGVSKAAMICYVSSTGHGLAIELNSDPSSSSSYLPADISGGSWRLPSMEDWQNMVNGCAGSILNTDKGEPFLSKYNATGVSFKATGKNIYNHNQDICFYWTSDTFYPDPMNPDPGKIKTYYIYFYLKEFRSGYGSEGLTPGHHYYLYCFAF